MDLSYGEELEDYRAEVQKFLELSLELRIGAGFPIRLLQLFQRGHERFRNEYAPVVAKMARI